MTDDRLARIEDKLARLEIVEAMWRYSRAVDRHDNAMLADLFWPDCEINYTNIFSGDRAAFLAWANPHHRENYINHQHHTTAHIIDVHGDTANGEHYCIVFLQRADGTILLSTGRYLQQWERRDGEWRILVREFMPEISSGLTGPTARLSVTPTSLQDMYAETARPMDVRAAQPWAPFPPSGASRWDRRDLAFRSPLGTRDDRADIAAWLIPSDG